MSTTFDYVIVGAGTAGCVLANRLSNDPSVRVMLLEAGGRDRHPFVQAPAGFLKTFDSPKFNWCFSTAPGKGVDGRSIFFPRGKVLGGSSSINGHLYVRGQARDYDNWAQLGNQGWGYDDVLPYFKKSEDRSSGADLYHGSGGPQHISDIHERHPICDAFIDGADSLGVPRNTDYNGAQQEGVAYYQRMIKNGVRHSAASGFLHPIKHRSNLQVVTHAEVERVLFDGRRAKGLQYRQHGETKQVEARREVILAAGVIGSPQLLQVSGVGNPDHLRQIGVNTIHALPSVGEGLQDHYAVRVVNDVTKPITLNERARGPRLLWEIAKWYATGKSLLAFSPAHVAAFVRSSENLQEPDLQFVFTPASYSVGVVGKLQKSPGMTIGVWQLRPKSTGYVRAVTANANDAPEIQPNYLVEDADQKAVVDGLKWCRKLVSSDALLSYRGPETLPGNDVQNDEDLLAYARTHGATVYHAVSTCRMGVDDRAVVDPQLRVHGLENLRVVDASVMPTMVSANTNAATMMIAEKASDLIAAANR